MKAYQLKPNSCKTRSNYIYGHLGLFYHFREIWRTWFLDVSSNNRTQSDAGTCCPCWGTFKGTEYWNAAMPSHSFSGPGALSPELWVSHITSAFSLLTALQVQGYCSLGHYWLFLVNSALSVFALAKRPGRNWVWGPRELHRGRGQGTATNIKTFTFFPSTLLDGPLPLPTNLLCHKLLIPRVLWVLPPGNSRHPGCWGKLARAGKGLCSGTSPYTPRPTHELSLYNRHIHLCLGSWLLCALAISVCVISPS